LLLNGLSYAPGPSTLTSIVERFASRDHYRLAELRRRRVGAAGRLDG